jgi:hypothetical protein
VRRAKALTPFVQVDGLPASALQALRRDSLIISDPTDGGRFAPTHDVYEDWALILWLDRAYDQEGELNARFFANVETHPAMRRAFRRWLTEKVEYESKEADSKISGILNDPSVDQVWKDDALVAILQSSESSAFLGRMGTQLLGNNMLLLRRAVHLLRVACCKMPPQGSSYSPGSTLLIPSGPAWDAMPVILVAALSQLKMEDFQKMLRFAEQSVTRTDKSPTCDAALGIIVRCLQDGLININYSYRRPFQERVLNLMVAIPRELETEIRKMLVEALPEDRRGGQRETLPDLIWNHLSGANICREFPDITMTVAEQRLELSPVADERRRRHRHSFNTRLEVDDVFGCAEMDAYPASAWQGPFLNLLSFHPEHGLDLILQLLNSPSLSNLL